MPLLDAGRLPSVVGESVARFQLFVAGGTRVAGGSCGPYCFDSIVGDEIDGEGEEGTDVDGRVTSARLPLNCSTMQRVESELALAL